MIVVTVCYPIGVDFDAEYYASKHMPLVREGFGKHGLRKDEVRTLKATPTGAPPRFQVMTSLYFDDMGALGAAFASPEGRTVAKDVKNFYPGEPEVMIGEITPA
ncbi:MAG: EthD family reductase [Vulcanimicrobiaceae bacterium]|jgi:uncharacterized protein (TIGR02118 family)